MALRNQFVYLSAGWHFRTLIGNWRWYVYLANKTYDSRERAKWRKTLFRISIVLFIFGLIATIIEAVEKARGKEEPREPFSAEYCLKQLIKRVEGADAKQSEQMQTLLQKVLIEGVDLRDAVAPWQMSPARKLLLHRKAFKSLQGSLARLVNRFAEIPPRDPEEASMTLGAAWKELLPRLETDLSANQSTRFQADDKAWSVAERFLRTAASIACHVARHS